jgi:hypothetical protein
LLRETLEFALKLKRPYAGTGVAALAEFLLALPSAFEDDFGNIHVPVGRSTTLFSSHIDTMHQGDGINPYKVIFDTDDLINAYGIERKPNVWEPIVLQAWR